MTVRDRYAQILALNGVSLDALGLQDVALRKEDALRAIQVLKESSVPILGGDVYVVRAEDIQPAYSNWYIDQQEGETLADFAERSYLESENYVARYPQRADEQPLFVFVLQSVD